MNDCPRQNPAYRPTQSIPATHSYVRSFSCWLWVAIKLLQKLLQRRSNHIYYFRWVCPEKVRQIVGKWELIKSLHTQDEMIARVRASRYYDAVLKITHVLNMTDLTDEQIEAAVQRAWSKIGSSQKELLTESELQGVVQKAWGGLDAALRRKFNESELETFSYCGVDDDLDYWIEEIDGLKGQFDQITGKFHGSPDNITAAFAKYKLNLRDYHRDDCELLFQELKRMEYEAAWGFYRKYRDWESHLHSLSSLIINKPNEAPALKFSELYSRFIEFKTKGAKLSDDMQSEYQRYYDTFINLEGDLPITEIKRLRIKEFLMEKYRYLPRRNLGQYKGIPASELLEMEIPEEDLIADSTVLQVLKFLQGMFAYALDKQLLEISPMQNVNKKKLGLESRTPYGAYSDPQIRCILDAVKDLTAWKYWVPMLGIYTGARLGEIVQLRREDVIRDETTQRYYMRITKKAGKVKTKNANRNVPLHSEIIAAGFLKFVDEAEAVLFPGLASPVATNWFRSFRCDLGIPDKNNDDQKLVFHSFRHTFVSVVRSTGLSDVWLLQHLVGHEKTNSGLPPV